MKKLMIAMAAVAMACAANATATWQIVNAEAYEGYRAVMLFGTDKSTYDKTAAETNAKDTFDSLYMSDAYWGVLSATSWSEYYTALRSMGGDFETYEIVNGKATTGISYANKIGVLLLLKDGITAGSEYVMTEALYPSSTAEVDFTGMKSIQTGTLRKDSAPEPTSGLLLLLGMAGLALKRKQK